MRIKSGIDLLIICVISLMLVPAIIFSPSTIPRILLGLPFILFFPGYVFMAALFPARNSLGLTERLVYSLVVSIAIVALDGLLLNYILSITLFPILGSLVFIILALSILAAYRRRRIQTTTGPAWKFDFSWNRLAPATRLMGVILILALLSAVGVSIHTFADNNKGYSEFYLLGPGGQAENYPNYLRAGEEGQILLVLVNHEHSGLSYHIKVVPQDCRVFIDGKEQSDISVTLNDGQQRAYDVTFICTKPGEGKKLEFDLFKDNNSNPYLITYLKLTILP